MQCARCACPDGTLKKLSRRRQAVDSYTRRARPARSRRHLAVRRLRARRAPARASGPGRAVDIEAKPLEVLRQLLLHAGEVVTKAELLEAVWPGRQWWTGRWPPRSRRFASSWATTTRSSSRSRASGTSWPCRCTAGPPALRFAGFPLEPGQSVPGPRAVASHAAPRLSPSSEVWLAEHPKTRETRVFKFATDERA